VGLQTVETCAAHGVAVLGLEARRALLLDREQIVACARRRRVTVCTLD
jgi:DUF1009 family protein